MRSGAGMTRRRAVGGIAAAALLGMQRRSFAAGFDVLIVGAGAAGISAAREFERLGLSFALVEARGRIGGRAFTDTSLGPRFDAGAEIIHFAQDNPWVDIARELDVPIDPSGGRMGGWQVYAGGKPLGPLERARRWQGFREMEARMARMEASGRDASLAEAVADLDPDLRAVAASGLLLVLGEDGERISVLDNQRLWSGPDFTTVGGYGALVAAYGRGLPVSLSTSVTAIRWGDGGVEAETTRGVLRARAAIVTVPVNVLKSGAIRFSPALPAATLGALDGMGMGALTKIALRLERPDRFGLGASTTLMDATSAAATTMIEMFPDGRDLAVAVCGGDFARSLAASGEAASIAHVADALAAMLGSDARKAVAAGKLASWWADPLSQGAYSICRPGHAGAREALARPVAMRLWLAGEAAAGGGSMTVGGATLSARRAAAECAAGLKG